MCKISVFLYTNAGFYISQTGHLTSYEPAYLFEVPYILVPKILPISNKLIVLNSSEPLCVHAVECVSKNRKNSLNWECTEGNLLRYIID